MRMTHRSIPIHYILASFLSAFLLFQVQPLLGKFILPWFGGGPAVWTVCLLFFQVVLLGGYTYAHWLTSYLSHRRQVALHGILLTISLATLPVIPDESWKLVDNTAPTLRILSLLTLTVAIPYLCITSTTPLLQKWFSQTHPKRSPYRLYVLSNLGSLLGLLSYPFILEPRFGLRFQIELWSVAYGLFVLLSLWCALLFFRDAPVTRENSTGDSIDTSSAAPSPGTRLLWVVLPACASLLLMATTNQITQDIAPVPFLWVLPMSLYLLSFIICFDHDRWYDRRIWTPFFLGGLIATCVVLNEGFRADIGLQALVYSLTLFACCMICHGELAQLRPRPRHLTSFYLYVALGGALGGAFVSFVAPRLFPDFWELHLGLVGAYLLFSGRIFSLTRKNSGIRKGVGMGLAAGAFALGGSLVAQIHDQQESAILTIRNFYGVLTVYELGRESSNWRRYLYSGRVPHGSQAMSRTKRGIPTTYFGVRSGIGTAINQHPRRRKNQKLHVGAVGLGAGTISAQLSSKDQIRYYDINPATVEISDSYFTYRKDSPAREAVVVGDARIELQRELERDSPQGFDILVLDAFSADAVPVHLLTREAMEIYWRHLKPDGILAVHISAVHLDLSPVIRGLASELGKQSIRIKNRKERRNKVWSSTWVLMTDNPEFLKDSAVKSKTRPWSRRDKPPIVWTDDYSNLLHVLK